MEGGIKGRPLDPRIISRLKEIVRAERVATSAEELVVHGYDATLPEFLPQAVVFPDNAGQISEILKLANREKIPVYPRGAGTNLSGGSIPVKGGIVLSLVRMNRILEVSQENLYAVVEPGVVNADFQAHLQPMGLFFPPDPASMNVCTLGGNVAEGSGGPRCLKYGVTRDYILGLEVVLPTGEIIQTGGVTVKNSTGYDLTRLFVGSEGTLGVVTRITCRLLPLPEAKKTMLAVFDEIAGAGAAVGAIIAASIIPLTLELMDNVLINCAEDFAGAGLPRDAQAVLLIEVDGFKEALDRQIERIASICGEHRAREVRMATTPEEVNKLWLARRTVIGAVARVRPSYSLQDITVPRSKLPEIVRRIEEIAKWYDLPIGVLAHAGDGNLHPLVLFDKRNHEEHERVLKAEREICQAALDLGGTLSGEHGIGFSKMELLPMEFSPELMDLTRKLRQLFDPNGILNPGKVVEPALAARLVPPARTPAEVKGMPLSTELYEQISKCNKCGFCQATCRVYKEALSEGYCARGRVRLIKAVHDGQIPISDKYVKIIESCAQCLECAFTCPSGVGPDRIIRAAREELIRVRGLRGAKKFALRYLFPEKRRLTLAFRGLRLAQKYVLNWAPGLANFRGVDARRFPVAERTLEEILAGPTPAPIPAERSGGAGPRLRVGFFYGCMINNTLPEIGLSVIRVLERNGVEVVIPSEQVCCGTPMYISGEVETARRMARINIRVFKNLGVDAVVTACGSCGEALQKEYPVLFQTDPDLLPWARAFADKVQDISAFLVDRLGLGGPTVPVDLDPRSEHTAVKRPDGNQAVLGPVKGVVTYHDSCHLNRGMGVNRQPRALIMAIPGLTFKELPEADRCCGGAGLHQVFFSDLAIPTSRRKVENIARTGADTVVTGCPACIQRIQGTLNLAGMKKRVVHPIQLLDEAYRAAEKPVVARDEDRDDRARAVF